MTIDFYDTVRLPCSLFYTCVSFLAACALAQHRKEIEAQVYVQKDALTQPYSAEKSYAFYHLSLTEFYRPVGKRRASNKKR